MDKGEKRKIAKLDIIVVIWRTTTLYKRHVVNSHMLPDFTTPVPLQGRHIHPHFMIKRLILRMV